MAAEVIQEFLVSLGFEIDESQLSGFKAGLLNAAKAATIMGAAIAAMAVAVTAAISSVANEFDELDDSSRMIGTTAEKLKELQYAGEFMDTSTEAVTSSLKSLGKMAGEASLGIGKGAKMFEKLGIEANNSDGSLRDTVEILGDVQRKMDGMAQGEKLAIMSKLGIDPTMIDMLSNDISGLTAEFQALSEATGIDWNKSGAEAGAFADNLKKLQMTFGLVWKSVAAGFFKKFSDGFESLQKKMVVIAPKLIRIFTPILSFFVEMAGLFSTLVTAIVEGIDWIVTSFDELEGVSKTVATALVGLGAAWLAFNLLVKASPLGRMIALFTLLATAVALLVDDYETFNEGGESFFDWSGKVIPNLKLIAYGLGLVLAGFVAFKVVTGILSLITGGIAAMNAALAMNPIVLILAGMAAGMMLAYGIYQMFSTEITDFFHETIPAGLEVVGGVFRSLVTSIILFMTDIIEAVSNGLSYIWGLFVAGFEVVSGVFSAILAFIINTVASIIEAVSNGLSYIWGLFVAGGAVVRGVFATILATVINIMASVRQAINDAVEYIKSVFTAGVELVKGVFSNLGASIIESMAGVMTFFSDLWANISDGAANTMSTVANTLGRGASVNVGVTPSPFSYAAGTGAGGGLTQTNNYSVTASDPVKAATLVKGATETSNKALVRNIGKGPR
jgi:phage-related protein